MVRKRVVIEWDAQLSIPVGDKTNRTRDSNQTENPNDRLIRDGIFLGFQEPVFPEFFWNPENRDFFKNNDRAFGMILESQIAGY